MKQLITIALLLSLSGCAYYSDYYGQPAAIPEAQLQKAYEQTGECALNNRLAAGTLTEEAQYMMSQCRHWVVEACRIKARNSRLDADSSNAYERAYYNECINLDTAFENFFGLAARSRKWREQGR